MPSFDAPAVSGQPLARAENITTVDADIVRMDDGHRHVLEEFPTWHNLENYSHGLLTYYFHTLYEVHRASQPCAWWRDLAAM